MRGCNWLMGLVLLGAGWPGLVVGQDVDMEEVRRRAEKYEREAAEEAAKKAPAPKPQPKPAPAPKPQPKPAPAVDHDREAWQSAEKCGTAACFEAYLEEYPKGRYARMARARLKPAAVPQTPEATVTSVATPESAPAVMTTVTSTARPSQRFTDNYNGTITDNQTGLIWLKSANCWDNRKGLHEAKSMVKKLASGYCGLNDGSVAGQWRLPSNVEWSTLIDHNAPTPTLPVGHPFTGVQADKYWSSTTWDRWRLIFHIEDGGLVASLDVGQLVEVSAVSYQALVWPVRDRL